MCIVLFLKTISIDWIYTANLEAEMLQRFLQELAILQASWKAH